MTRKGEFYFFWKLKLVKFYCVLCHMNNAVEKSRLPRHKGVWSWLGNNLHNMSYKCVHRVCVERWLTNI